jgi:SAM-dependent methyltransferase
VVDVSAPPQVAGALASDRDIQHERLTLLAELLDPGTLRLLDALGVQAGMRCLALGPGCAAVAGWLCRRVGPGGSVLATGLETTAPARLEHHNLEIREQDLLAYPLPECVFDLVHARVLLASLPDPRAGLLRIFASLKPGGRVLLEEMDFVSVAPDPSLGTDTRRLLARVIGAQNTALPGFDPQYGRRLAGELVTAGLVSTGCEGRASVWQGGRTGGRVWQLTLLQQRDALITAGLLTREDIDTVLELCENPRLRLISPITMAAWGHWRAPAKPRLSTLARA